MQTDGANADDDQTDDNTECGDDDDYQNCNMNDIESVSNCYKESWNVAYPNQDSRDWWSMASTPPWSTWFGFIFDDNSEVAK